MTQARAAGTIPRDLSKLEARAAKVLDPDALAYILAGAGDTNTTRANAAAFRRWRIKRRKGRKPAKVDLSTTVLGTRMPAPVLFAPVGVQTLAHPDGELATAPAAAELGLTYLHSTQASYKMEDVAAANGDGSRWYQLYWPTDDELVVSFLRRAKAAGYTHLVITLDTTLLGWRPLDLDRGYTPFLENKGIANYTSDPVFQRRLIAPAEVARRKACRQAQDRRHRRLQPRRPSGRRGDRVARRARADRQGGRRQDVRALRLRDPHGSRRLQGACARR